MAFPKRRRSKFGVFLDAEGKARRTYKGKLYDSQAECDYAIQLDFLIELGEVTSWRGQVRFKLFINGRKVMMRKQQAERKVDFEVKYPDGHIEFHEVKGRTTPDFLLRQRIFELTYLVEHPEIIYREIAA